MNGEEMEERLRTIPDMGRRTQVREIARMSQADQTFWAINAALDLMESRAELLQEATELRAAVESLSRRQTVKAQLAQFGYTTAAVLGVIGAALTGNLGNK